MNKNGIYLPGLLMCPWEIIVKPSSESENKTTNEDNDRLRSGWKFQSLSMEPFQRQEKTLKFFSFMKPMLIAMKSGEKIMFLSEQLPRDL